MVTNNIPQWAKKYFRQEDFLKVERAIEEVESKTSAEIVPMVVRQSITSGHVLYILFFGIYVLLNLVMNEIPVFPEYQLYLDLTPLVFSLLLSYFLQNLPILQRALTPSKDIQDQVEQRALVEFYQSHFHKTEGATGILIFVSLVERKAFVLADKAINQIVTEDTWSEVIKLLTGEFKSGRMGNGFEKAIQKCGEIVTPHFPISPDDNNELKDHLIFRD